MDHEMSEWLPANAPVSMKSGSSPRGNLYGLDIKLAPVDGSIVPSLIEMNGVDYGTNFFKYEAGAAFYRAYARVLGAHAKGKPLFIERVKPGSMDAVAKAVEVGRIESRFTDLKQRCAEYRQVFAGTFEFEDHWLDDLRQFELGNLEASDDETDCYLYAAKEEGVPLYSFTSIRYGSNNLAFLLGDGWHEVAPHGVGMIHAKSGTLFDAPERYKNLFISSQLHETVTGTKPFTGLVAGIFASNTFGLCMPAGLPYGFGVTSKEALLWFLGRCEGNYVVRKRATSYCGTGVDILNKADTIDRIRKRQDKGLTAEQTQALLKLILSNLGSNTLEDFLSVYEQFMPSIPIRHPRTGKLHDGCARAVVYAPAVGDPICLGAQWRLAPKALDETGSLEDKFRANLSRGATEAPVTEHYELVSQFAECATKWFEQGIAKFRQDYSGIAARFRKDCPQATEADVFRIVFWTHWLMPKMKKSGFITPRGVNELPESDRLMRAWREQLHWSKLVE